MDMVLMAINRPMIRFLARRFRFMASSRGCLVGGLKGNGYVCMAECFGQLGRIADFSDGGVPVRGGKGFVKQDDAVVFP